jgi:four helix bundle protein
METKNEGHFNEIMRIRTLAMAVKIHSVFREKKITQLNRPMVNQLIRSSSSVAANFRAATRARSDAEFYSKICIVTEECDETQFWIGFLTEIGVLQNSEIAEINNEVDQLIRIFTSIKKTMQLKLKG